VAGAGAIAACSSFGSDAPAAPPTDPDAVAPPPTPDGARPDGADDGGPPDASPACVSPGPSCALGACERKSLYVPAGNQKEYPFEIATDDAHVYWVAQVATPPFTESQAYNGGAPARIWRTDRTGAPGVGNAQMLASDQKGARRVAIDGPYLYWVTLEDAPTDGTMTRLNRVPRDCMAPCTPEAVLDIGSGPLNHFVRIGPSLFLAHTANGSVLRVDANARKAVQVGATSNYPGLATTPTAAYVSGLEIPDILRLDLLAPGAAASTFATFTDFDAAAPTGAKWLATDCTTLFAIRSPHVVWRMPLTPGATPSMWVPELGRDVWSVAIDASYLYFVAANSGGVFGIDGSGNVTPIEEHANVWHLAVDDQGVYWGEHDATNPGIIRMMAKR
jgi:hypothetical protein